jgi:hypothetical protein
LHGFDKAARRSVVHDFNLATLALTTLAYVATGVSRRRWGRRRLQPCSCPSLLGARLCHRLSEKASRRPALGLLAAAGAVMPALAAPRVFGLSLP